MKNIPFNWESNSSTLNLPLGDVLRGVALLGELVVDETELAALLPGRDAVEADEELSAVVGVRVLGVRVVLAELVRGRLLRTLEAAGSLQSCEYVE